MSKSVLVTDDTLYSRTLLKNILLSRGYRVVGEASNGREAVEQYRELRPDLVTMDISMPEMDGVAAVRQIREIDPDATILMCSSTGQRSLLVEAMVAGAAAFVTKPFCDTKVIRSVKKLIG
ncbi:MAG: response regulator [Armatimonadetes bacterium]|nr:response regulator [Armatimonadota bacterium]